MLSVRSAAGGLLDPLQARGARVVRSAAETVRITNEVLERSNFRCRQAPFKNIAS